MSNNKSIVFLSASLVFLLFGALATLFSKSDDEVKQARIIGQAVQKSLKRMDEEAARLMQADYRTWAPGSQSFFLINNNAVLGWTSNEFLPELRTIPEETRLMLLQVAQGDFLIRRWPIAEQRYLMGVLYLRRDYKIVNNYLGPVWNPELFSKPIRIIGAVGEGTPVLLDNGVAVFKIHDTDAGNESNTLALVGFGLASVAFLLFIASRVLQFHQRRKYSIAFLVLMAGLSGLRIVMVKLNFPNAFSDFSLFDPHRFASSSFNASMGDLLLNAISVLLVCIYLFMNYARLGAVKLVLRATRPVRLLMAVFCLTVCFFALLYPYLFIEIIYHNSSISLEVTDSIAFDEIRWVAILSLLIGCFSSFLFIHTFFRLAEKFTKNLRVRFWAALLMAALLFVLYTIVAEKAYWISLAVGLAFFALLYTGKIMEQFSRFTFKSFLYFLVVIGVFAIQGALSMEKFNEERSVRDQFRFGSRFLVDQDVLGEYLLDASAQQIARDPFIQTMLLNPFLSKNSIRQKVRQVYLGTYFDRYDIQINLYGASGEPYSSEAAMDFETMIRTYQGDAFRTAYPGIFFVNTPTGEITQQYLVIIPVTRRTLSAGYLVLNLRLKKLIPRNVYPELLVDNRFSHYFIGKDFSYAFFSQDRLTNSFGDFNYEHEFDVQQLSRSELYRGGLNDHGFHHVGMEDRNGQTVIVTAHNYSSFSRITNFSFLFVLGLGVVLCYMLITSAITWWNGSRLQYAARIQLYVYLAFFLPLLTVSITMLSVTSRNAEDQLRQEYEERAKAFGETMVRPNYGSQGEPDNYWTESQLTELAKLSDMDASVYSSRGELIASSQPLIFENRLISTLINRDAWNAVVRDKKTVFTTTERIGKLQYNCSYIPIEDPESGSEKGILSIPFFSSAQSLEKIQINVLANMLNIFVLVFLIFSVISFLIANGLTFPLRFIARSIKRTTLTGTNQMIQWNSNDEIGLLANEYNQMITNLEQSRAKLERVQKESAWREIAKQVAHEIKNPLTPMKLTLQQMEHALNNQGLGDEKAKKAVETLLEQLEILNEIATSFSTFARMPAPLVEQFDIIALLQNVASLHQNSPEGKVNVQIPQNSMEVFGNPQLLGRAFSNLIINALQSGKEGKKVTVTISAEIIEGLCLVRFEDNGRGIDDAIVDKVFLPHFSTKRTGSGLGLAITKQGIEQMGGKIWLETQKDKGTTFFIELNLAS